MRRMTHLITIATTIALPTIVHVGCAMAADARPNILFIMSDDHTTQALGAYGGRLAPLNVTPTLDRLAAEGILFTNCFVTNSICTPSRACILTGQYNHINGVYDLNGRLEPAKQVLPRAMKQAGYQTAMIGKWHLGAEPAAFDYYSVLDGQGKYFDTEYLERGPQPWPKNRQPSQGHVTDTITARGLDWLKNRRDPQRPFFLMFHHKAPHDMFEFAPRYADYLSDVLIPEPDSLWQQPEWGSLATRGDHDELLPYIGTSIGTRNSRRNYVMEWVTDAQLSPEQATRAAYNEYLKRYLRCVIGLDDSLATFFEYLRDSGLMENTLIVYTSDQGMLLGEHDLMDKRWMYDESQRMPLIVHLPGTVPADTRSDAIIENIDFAPTLLDFAGATPPATMQGRSFKSVCESGVYRGPKRAAYYRYWMHLAHHDVPAHFGIRTATHKLIFYYGLPHDPENPRMPAAWKPQTPPAWELYDLQVDPHELQNVIDDPAYATVAANLKQQLAAMRAENGDTDEQFPHIKAVVEEFWEYDAAARAKAKQISHEYRALKESQAARK